MRTTGQKTRRVGATYRGSVPDTDPLYQGGWNFILGRNLNLQSGEASTDTSPPPAAPKPEQDEQA